MLYSSTDPLQHNQAIDANSYPPFRVVDYSVMEHIMEEIDALGGPEEEGQPADDEMSPICRFNFCPSALCIGRGRHESPVL
jgi:hypothetical protein